MSKFGNHGLFTRTASASTRSSSLIAQARRSAPRRRSAAIPPTSSASASFASQPTSSQQPFIGPLTLAASQHVSAQASSQCLDTDSIWASDVTSNAAVQSHASASSSTSSVALSAAARQLSRSQATPFPHLTDRGYSHKVPPLHSIPQARSVHVFFPSAAASHALNPVSPASYEASYTVANADARTLASKRSIHRSKDVPRPAADYVPLWNASSASSSSSPSSTFASRAVTSPIDQHLNSMSLLGANLLDSSDYDVPITLFMNEDYTPGSASYIATVDWNNTDHSSSSWQSSSSSSKSSKSSSSSSSSSTSRPPTPTASARPHLATSTVKQDSSGTHASGSSTPTQGNDLAPHQIENSLLGPSSLLTTAAYTAQGNRNHLRGAATAAATESSDASHDSPLWTGSFASHKPRRLHYAFEHGAYGIPKRHPWAAVRGNGKRVQEAPKPVARTGAVGMLAAAADFLTGSTSVSGPSRPKEKLGGEALVDDEGRRLGLNSPIREHGRIVQDRLQSVQVGEDAYFLRPDSIGVADGVGGWASRAGADPALFSRLLMHFCAAELGKFDGLSADQLAAKGGQKLREWEQLDPVEVMHTAWERCVRASRREGILGSSTALLAVLRGDELKIANLGDCVLLIIRAGELLFRSTEQQHSFNFPVQLGMMGHTAESVTIAANRTLSRDGFLQSGASDDLDDNAPNPLGTTTPASMDEARKGRSDVEEGDEAEEAEWDEPRRDAGRWTIKVQKGDIIIVGSDGLMDNLFDEDIVEEVVRFAPPPDPQAANNPDHEDHEYHLPDDFCPQLVSEALCSRAKAVSEDARAVTSPFQQRAMEEGMMYVGGKHDDISVVVAVVGDPSEQLSRTGHSTGSDHGSIPGQFQQGEGRNGGQHISA